MSNNRNPDKEKSVLLLQHNLASLILQVMQAKRLTFSDLERDDVPISKHIETTVINLVRGDFGFTLRDLAEIFYVLDVDVKLDVSHIELKSESDDSNHSAEALDEIDDIE